MSFQYYESNPRAMELPCKSDNNRNDEKSKVTEAAIGNVTGKSPKTTDKKD